MKFKAAVIVSAVLHASLFAIALFGPSMSGSKSNGTPYYVRWANISGGGGGKSGPKASKSGGKTQAVQVERQRMKDLTTQKQESQSKIRYPDQNKKKKTRRTRKPKRKKQSLISMKRRDPASTKKSTDTSPVTVTRKSGGAGDLRTGISAGGGGSGNGTGSGGGDGSGIGSGSFPYAYYITTLRSKISSSWYNALISPGVRGRFVATVYFKILRNGQVSEVKVEGKSGLESLDLSAIRAIENASPFPPLPGDYPYSYLGVHFEFVWEKK